MNRFGDTTFDGVVELSQPAVAGGQAVRLSQLQSAVAGLSPISHTHSLADITDMESLGPHMAAVLSDTRSVDWVLSGGKVKSHVRLSPVGGLVETDGGIAVGDGLTATPSAHTHPAADIVDFIDAARAEFGAILSDTSTVEWDRAGALAARVRLAAASGLLSGTSGLSVDFGVGANQAARGNHTHAGLHDPVTLAASNTIAASLSGQQLSIEVRLPAASGLVAGASGLSVDFGSGANQAARGNHTHAGLHDPVSVQSTNSLQLGLTGQVLSGSVRIAPPTAGRGRLGLSGGGLYVELGSGSDVAAPGDHTHPVATDESDGLMSAHDKARFDGLLSGGLSIPGASFKIAGGNLLLWDEAAYQEDPARPWRVLMCQAGQLQLGPPTQ